MGDSTFYYWTFAVDVWYQDPVIETAPNPLDGGVTTFVRGVTGEFTVDLYWGGLRTEDTVYRQYWTWASGSDPDTGHWANTGDSPKTSVDGHTQFTFTPSRSVNYRFKVVDGDTGDTYYTQTFSVNRWIDQSVLTTDAVIEGEQARADLSALGYAQTTGWYDLSYSDDGGYTWHYARNTTATYGNGSFTVTPVEGRVYAAAYHEDTLPGETLTMGNGVTWTYDVITDIAITASGPEVYLPGDSPTLEYSTDPAVTTSAELWYRTDGGPWAKAATTLSVTDGVGTKGVSPSGVRDYKVVIGTHESNVVTMTPIYPDVVLSGPETYADGAEVTLEFSIDPPMTGPGEFVVPPGGRRLVAGGDDRLGDGGYGHQGGAPGRGMALQGHHRCNGVQRRDGHPGVSRHAGGHAERSGVVCAGRGGDVGVLGRSVDVGHGGVVVSHGWGVVAEGRDDGVVHGRLGDEDGASAGRARLQGGPER